ncbi:MAG: phenylacetate--CoA ligase [Clostridium sp.]|nr:phenylacetate--CoA ligase [Clostridium sp.]
MGYYQPEVECAPRERLREIQSERLNKMVRNCYDNVPFYRRKFDEMGIKPEDITSIDDITKLPFTVKQDLRDNYPYGLFAVKRDKLARIHASSGTTGKQTVVGYTKEDLLHWAEGAARAIVAAGGSANDFIHVSYGYGLFTGGLGLHDGAELLGAIAIPVSSGNTKRQIQILQDFRSDILCCTPSYAMFIGETLREMGIKPDEIPLRAGIFGAEAWSENMRREIEKALGIKAYDIYGLSEIAGPGVSYECEEQTGMHVCEDYFYPEIIDPDTLEPLPDGEYGELVFTCIGKEALPLVRYRTRDISCLTREKCSCGRTLVKMKKPRGRSDDMLIIRGVNVFPSQVEHVILQLGMEPNYQIVVERENNLDTMTVCIEMSDKMFSDEISEIAAAEKRIAGAMLSTLGVGAKVRLVEPRTLPRSEGKAVRVIDNRKI